MYVRAIVDEGVLPQGVLAPQQGILRDPKGNASALVVSAQGKVEPRAVKATRTIGDQWLIDEGLAAGDRLIVEGLQKVQPGMAVKAVEASEGVAGTPATAEPDAKAGSVAPASDSSASSAAAH